MPKLQFLHTCKQLINPRFTGLFPDLSLIDLSIMYILSFYFSISSLYKFPTISTRSTLYEKCFARGERHIEAPVEIAVVDFPMNPWGKQPVGRFCSPCEGAYGQAILGFMSFMCQFTCTRPNYELSGCRTLLLW